MTRKDRSAFVGIRIPDGLLAKIDFEVEDSGEFGSRSDFILCAIRSYIEQREMHRINSMGNGDDKRFGSGP